MEYVATINGETHRIDITELGANRYRLVIDQRVVEVDAAIQTEDRLSLILGHEVYAVDSTPRRGGLGEAVLVRGHLVEVEVLERRRLLLRRGQVGAGARAGARALRAPMPGRITALLVKEGQAVTEGQGLVVIEAMKMENELRSPKAGVVRALTVSVGTAVEGGTTLCLIE
jgi:acetyl/propionyl-CoA carboxylase alpha subunit